MRIGFIGLGNMGRHMVARLLAGGHQVLVHDLNLAAVDELAALGAERGGSASIIADEVEIILASLPTPGVVEAVLTGETGVINGSRVRTVIDLSTTGPVVSARVAARLREKNIDLVDAPVSGGVTGAEAGTLAIMVSGAPAAVDAAGPLLEVLGTKIFNLGSEAGQGQTMKVVNNMLCAAAAASAFEGLVLGAKAGIDSKTMLDVINASSGRSFATEVKIPQCVLERNFPLRFTTELLHKDVTLGIDEAARLGVPIPVNQAVRQFLAQGLSAGMKDQDYAHLIKLIEEPAGAQFGSAPSPSN